jgi:hypothetical protein
MFRLISVHTLIVLLTAATLVTATAQAQTTWYVDDDAPNDPGPGDPTVSDPLEDGSGDHPFDAIQECIDAAVDGDTVLVLDGTYTGTGNKNLDFHGKPITVGSENGPDTCIVDCEDTGRGLIFQNHETPASILEGLTITNGAAPDAWPWAGGAVYSYESSPTIRSCWIVNNHAEHGGGMYLRGPGNPTVIDCRVVGNASTNSGAGGIWCTNNCVLTIEDSVLADNQGSPAAGAGGGLLASHGGTSVTLRNCEISGNFANTGGGIGCDQSAALTVQDCNICDNESGNAAGGLSIDDGGMATVTSSVFERNRSTAGHGGSISAYESTLILRDSTLVTNTASSRGAAISTYRADARVDNCLIRDNIAQEDGGAFRAHGGQLTVTNSIIVDNYGLERGGGFYCAGTATVAVTNTVLRRNRGGEGSQIYLDGSATLTVSHCDVQGGQEAALIEPGAHLAWGDGNIDLGPEFAFPDDYHPTVGCAYIDAGTNDPLGGLPVSDPDGNARSLDGDGDGEAVADIGIYEFDPTAPTVALSPESVVFFVSENEPNPGDELLYLRNAGAGTLDWQIVTDSPWLQVNPSCGTTVDETDELSLSVDTAGLAHGTYVAALTVSAPLATNSPRTLEVVLHVTTVLDVPATYATIQDAIDAAVPGDQVVLADGFFSGPRNRNLDFHGRDITVRSAHGPENCVIDCEQSGLAFRLAKRESAAAVIDGITVMNGRAGIAGAVFCQYSSPTIRNCVFRDCLGDTAGNSAGAVGYRVSEATIADCVLTQNYGHVAGIRCQYSRITVRRCNIFDNARPAIGAENSSSLLVEDCRIVSNGNWSSGAGVRCNGGTLTILDCVVSNNEAEGEGGAVYCVSVGEALISNSLFVANSSDSRGGCISCRNSNLTISGCTFTGNSAYYEGGAVYNWDSTTTLVNSISWANSAATGPELSLSSAQRPCQLTVAFCDVAGGAPAVYVPAGCELVWGDGNIDADPVFVSPDADDFRVAAGSPCIDAADNEAVPADTFDLDGDGDTDEPIPFDLDGNPRFVDDPDTDDTGNGTPPIVDMGAYEFQAGVVAHLDIKPGSCPNPLNRDSHGVLPVAVVGTADFDVTQIDVETLVLARADGVGGSVSPLIGPPGPGIHVEDVATPFDGEPCECHELGADGIDDLSMKFDTEAIVAGLELNDLPGGVMVELVVSGELSDGTPFIATDCVRLVPPDSGGGSHASAGEDDARDVLPARRQTMTPEGLSAGDSSRADANAGELARPPISDVEDADADQDEDSQDASAMPLAACGALPPGLLLTAIGGTALLRCRRLPCRPKT